MRLLSRRISVPTLPLIFWVTCSASLLMGQGQANIILHNGKILTVDSDFSTAEAVAVSGEQIAAVGADQDVLRLAGPATQVIDLKGKTVIPGLIDTHRHIHGEAEGDYGGDLGPEELRRYSVDWRGVRSKEDVLNQIKGLMDKHQFPPGEWVYFRNQLSLAALSGSEAGSGSLVDLANILYDELNRWEIDKVTPDNPVVLSMGIPDWNGFLVNSKAIDILWDQHGEFIEHYGRYWIDSSGTPEGHLEAPATRLLRKYVYNRSPEVLAPLYRQNLEELNAAGITTVSSRIPEESVEAYKLLESKGEMSLRMAYGMDWYFGTVRDPEEGLKELGKFIGSGSDKIWVTSIAPTAVDGAATRACTDQKRTTAFGAIHNWWPVGQCHSDIEFRGAQGKAAPIKGNYFREWTINSGLTGVRFGNTHVAGDKSVRMVLSMVEQIQQEAGTSATKNWAFDHCTLVNPSDFERAARLGIMFSCAPKYIEDVAPGAAQSYGERVANTFVVPVKSMLDAGVKVVFESDRRVYEWHDLELLLTRKDRTGKVWGPQERVDRATALNMITRWAADYVLKGDKLGSIEPGKLADLVVLDKDYMTIPEEEVSEIRPRMTMLDGDIIYLHPQFAQEHNLRPAGAIVASYEELIARRTSRSR